MRRPGHVDTAAFVLSNVKAVWAEKNKIKREKNAQAFILCVSVFSLCQHPVLTTDMKLILDQ